VRSVVTTSQQVMRCLWLSMWSGAIVCGVAILQSLKLFGVPKLLAAYYAPLTVTSSLSIGRGSSLLGLPAAVADLAILNLAIAVGLLVRGHRRRLLLAGLAVLFVLGVVAAAEFATVFGLLVAVAVMVALTKSGRILRYAGPVALLAGVVLWPVISHRLSGFQTGGFQLPPSWVVRLQHLESYFWPVLFSDYNWILGVQPDARVFVPTTQYDYVWIESGYTWLLWGGGIPLLASYIGFVWAVMRKGFSYARRADAAGVVGFALAVAVTAQAFTMIFDPHLTFRGSGDAFFLTLALLRVLPSRRAKAAGDRVIAEAADAGYRPQEVVGSRPQEVLV
jgi:hypothetical protein